MISAQQAKELANTHLRGEGSDLVAFRASMNKRHGVWVVGYRDPHHLDEMLIGGALVVTNEGEVHGIGSTPDAVDLLMDQIHRGSVATVDAAQSREHERLPAQPEDRPHDAADLASSAGLQRPWPGQLGEELAKPYFGELMRFVDHERCTGAVYPRAADLFAAFHLTPYEKVKVVILGQDPYHQPGLANGLCFSVPRDVFPLPPSFRNIRAALAQDGFASPPHGDLTDWAKQGVLLLNTALTVRESEANSHATQWREFTDAVITKLSDRSRPVVFVLWGKAAQRKRALICEDQHGVVTAPHPAARGRFQAEFRRSGTFTEVNRWLKRFNQAPINWVIS